MGTETGGLVDLRDSDAHALVELLAGDADELLAGLVRNSGEDFLKWATRYLQESLAVDCVFVGALSGESGDCIQTLQVSLKGEHVDNFVYDQRGAPCALVMARNTCYACANVSSTFASSPLFSAPLFCAPPFSALPFGDTPIEAYVGMALFDPQGVPLGIAVILNKEPITEAKARAASARLRVLRARLEIELLHRQPMRLEIEHRKSIGDLASGVAHDFNNMLFAVSGQAHIVDRMHKNDQSLHEQMSIIQAACDQAGALCKELLTYAARQPSGHATLDLNEVVLGCQRIASVFAKGGTSIDYQLADSPIMLEGNLQRLQQVLMNLLKRAADAVPSGGSIRVATRVQDCTAKDFEDALAGERPKAGRYGVLQVQDNGTGMPAMQLQRILLPLASANHDECMGLALVMGGAQEHGATVVARSAPGEGTSFQIYFPLA